MARKNSKARGKQPGQSGDADFLRLGPAGFKGKPITKVNVRKPPTAGPKGIGAG